MAEAHGDVGANIFAARPVPRVEETAPAAAVAEDPQSDDGDDDGGGYGDDAADQEDGVRASKQGVQWMALILAVGYQERPYLPCVNNGNLFLLLAFYTHQSLHSTYSIYAPFSIAAGRWHSVVRST